MSDKMMAIQEMEIDDAFCFLETKVDIVFVIDATQSMQPCIDMVKESALSFFDNLRPYLEEAGRFVTNIRLKVIWFRDFYYDGKFAYGESKFFDIPEEQPQFHDFVTNIREAGGYDAPESGLEALTLAMRSDFVQGGERRRHIIVLFTDDGAHPFEDYDQLVAKAAVMGCEPEMYPENMPKDLAELFNAWQGNEEYQSCLGKKGNVSCLDPTGRRLVLFAPNAYPWTDMENSLENTIRKNIEPQKGGSELDMSDVYALIAYSMQK